MRLAVDMGTVNLEKRSFVDVEWNSLQVIDVFFQVTKLTVISEGVFFQDSRCEKITISYLPGVSEYSMHRFCY